MKPLQLKLLGEFRLLRGPQQDIALPAKAQMLLAYLALNAHQRHQRDMLASLLWENRPEEQTRQSLRQCLFILGKALGDREPVLVIADRHYISLNTKSLDVDVWEFERLVAEGSPEALLRAVGFFTGELLDGLIDEREALNAWYVAERARLHDQLCAALAKLAAYQVETDQLEQAIQTARRLIALDPIREDAHCMLMQFYEQAHRRAAALRQYQICAETLQRELQIEPESETTRLYLEIRSRASEDDTTAKLATPQASLDAMFARPAIAVLPFTNIGKDPEQEYFSDGLTEDIITLLSAWRSFPVIARNSTFAYKGLSTDVRQVARELGARYVIEGGVRRSTDRVRVTAQLIDAETGHHHWAEKFDGALGNIFEIQDEITQRIVATVEPELEQAEIRKSSNRRTANLSAWDYYLRGMAELHRMTERGIAAARQMFEKAIDVDPEYSDAHAGLSMTHQYDIMLEFSDDRDASLAKVFELARRAVELDNGSSYAHLSLGGAYIWSNEHDLSIAETRMAMDLNPSNVHACLALGNRLDLAGNPDEGIPLLEKSLRLNPRDPRIHRYFANLGRANINERQYEKALEWLQEAIRRRPDYPHTHHILAICLGHLGKLEEARAAAEECERLHPGFIEKRADWNIYRDPAANQHLLDGLRKISLLN